ncbi:hypothetical protein R70723_02520 [Paenibacillus sp. FSL R7-0273]|uniref:DUF1361 domain-containing protein n=1 Tax=Paenibacillus sp. FSL R7-0273 TaxID=1536772 RepID=UPI0004F89F5E|nr:DUF1361 domain-containing protein [Paenibacillus sp. FSL R7-0273]AIQ44902.1 hypothetical protein R70723_02520 [Paenibacillus sp. FSL R7-0273]OMF93246.1 hypothetical protein BK144_11030 [Paenibacillus sp. FSL R7-0273]
MKELNYTKVFILLAGLSLATLGVYHVVSLRTDTYFKFLLWNLFLAWVPFLISSIACMLDKQKYSSMLLLPLGIAWLLFFPNAPYLMTDLLHLTARKSIYILSGEVQSRFWYDLVTLLLFTWSGWLTGFFSLYQFQNVISRKSNLFFSWIFVLAACALGGYGVLLGRVYRLNSWDVLTDWHQLVQLVTDSLNQQSLFFSLFVAVVLLVIYATLYFLLNGLISGGGRSYSRGGRK